MNQAKDIVLILAISYFLLLITHYLTFKNPKIEGYQDISDITDMELGTIQLGNSGQLKFNGHGTYYHDYKIRSNKCSKNKSPFVFIQPLYQRNSPEYPDNFSSSIQYTDPCSFRLKLQRTDSPHGGWGQSLRAMYGVLWVKDKDANTPTVNAHEI